MRSALLAIVLVACGRGSDRAAPPSRAPALDGPGVATGSADASGSSMSNPPSDASTVTIVAKVTGTRPGRPPLQRLIVDVAIDNPGDAPRWILIPKQVPPNPDTAGGGVDSLEVRGTGAALFGTFRGVAGTYALRVAAHAKVMVGNVEIGWWRSSPDDQVPALEVGVADQLTIGGEPAKAWFGVEPLVPGGARLDATSEPTGAHAHEGDEAMLGLTGATTASAPLSLPAP